MGDDVRQSAQTACQVAIELPEKDALNAHVRDKPGLSDAPEARPLQAAFSSAATFSLAAALPLLAAVLAPVSHVLPIVAITTILALALSGALGAVAGGASMARGATRAVVGGVLAMAATAGVGNLFGLAG